MYLIQYFQSGTSVNSQKESRTNLPTELFPIVNFWLIQVPPRIWHCQADWLISAFLEMLRSDGVHWLVTGCQKLSYSLSGCDITDVEIFRLLHQRLAKLYSPDTSKKSANRFMLLFPDKIAGPDHGYFTTTRAFKSGDDKFLFYTVHDGFRSVNPV